MTGPKNAPLAAENAVPHEIGPAPGLGEGGARSRCSCARCGGPLPVTGAGRPRQDARYCSPRCRRAATVARRAAARDELRAALLDMEAELRRVSAAARALGILSDRPRTNRPAV